MKLLLKHRYLLQRADRTKLRSSYSFEYENLSNLFNLSLNHCGAVVESFAFKSEDSSRCEFGSQWWHGWWLHACLDIMHALTFCIIFDSIFSENGVVTGNKYLDISEDIQISSVMGGTRVAQWCKRRHVFEMDWVRFPVTTKYVIKSDCLYTS